MQCAPGPRTPSSIAIPYHFGSGPSGTSLGSSVSAEVGVPCLFRGWRGGCCGGIVCRSQLVTIIKSIFTTVTRFWCKKWQKHGIPIQVHIECADYAHSIYSDLNLPCFWPKWSILTGRKNDKVPYHLQKSDDFHTNLHTKNDKVPYHGHSRLRH